MKQAKEPKNPSKVFVLISKNGIPEEVFASRKVALEERVDGDRIVKYVIATKEAK